jgi:hypothetical protein
VVQEAAVQFKPKLTSLGARNANGLSPCVSWRPENQEFQCGQAGEDGYPSQEVRAFKVSALVSLR